MHCMLNLRREWQEIGGCNNNQAVVNKSMGNLVEDVPGAKGGAGHGQLQGEGGPVQLSDITSPSPFFKTGQGSLWLELHKDLRHFVYISLIYLIFKLLAWNSVFSYEAG